MGNSPIYQKNNIQYIDSVTEKNPLKDKKTDLNFRILEVLVQAMYWLYPE